MRPTTTMFHLLSYANMGTMLDIYKFVHMHFQIALACGNISHFLIGLCPIV